MKELQGNKMDALISASLYRNVSKEAEAFMSLDVSGIKDNPHIKNRILNRAKNKRSASWISTLRIAAVACLIIISMVFTACMCIPEVRESMWNAFVEWYDDHISVRFKQHEDATGDVTKEEESSDIQEPPSRIEDNVVATYLPEGYYSEVSETSSMFTHILCYDAEGNMMFRLVQTVLGDADEDDILLDNENDPITTMHINGSEGILVEYPDVPGLYYLVWQDESYQYSLYGSFTSVSELMKIAEGIRTE